jgi:hypothetical protein
MAETARCPHRETRLVAQDKDAEYRECLDCGAILEKAELAAAAPAAATAPSGAAPGDAAPKDTSADKPGFDESLSDA